jgi:hypothetical protein
MRSGKRPELLKGGEKDIPSFWGVGDVCGCERCEAAYGGVGEESCVRLPCIRADIFDTDCEIAKGE